MTDEELLGVQPGATVAEVRAAFRELARTLHPDHGGDPEEFIRARDACDRLIATAPNKKPCGDCRGRGKRKAISGFYVSTMTCASCGGSGEAT